MSTRTQSVTSISSSRHPHRLFTSLQRLPPAQLPRSPDGPFASRGGTGPAPDSRARPGAPCCASRAACTSGRGSCSPRWSGCGCPASWLPRERFLGVLAPPRLISATNHVCRLHHTWKPPSAPRSGRSASTTSGQGTRNRAFATSKPTSCGSSRSYRTVALLRSTRRARRCATSPATSRAARTSSTTAARRAASAITSSRCCSWVSSARSHCKSPSAASPTTPSTRAWTRSVR